MTCSVRYARAPEALQHACCSFRPFCAPMLGSATGPLSPRDRASEDVGREDARRIGYLLQVLTCRRRNLLAERVAIYAAHR